jgi:hypothetical protein
MQTKQGNTEELKTPSKRAQEFISTYTDECKGKQESVLAIYQLSTGIVHKFGTMSFYIQCTSFGTMSFNIQKY